MKKKNFLYTLIKSPSFSIVIILTKLKITCREHSCDFPKSWFENFSSKYTATLEAT